MKQTSKVSWGPTSSLFLASFLASLIPLINQIVDNGGALPTKEALISGGLLLGLGILRTAQQIVLDKLAAGGNSAPDAQANVVVNADTAKAPVATGVL
jgi:hypothetical protein